MDYSGLMDFRRCSWIFPSYWEWNNIPTDFKSIFQRGRVGIPPTSHGFDELIHTRTEESGETWKDELGGFHWRFSVISCSRSRFWGAGILYLTTGERDLEENRGRVCEEQGCLSSTVVFLLTQKKGHVEATQATENLWRWVIFDWRERGHPKQEPTIWSIETFWSIVP